jgi:carboxyl-terminal processing protease
MRVVNEMDQQNFDGEQQQEKQPVKPASKFIKMKPFVLVMLLFFTILCTAGLTVIVLTFGDDKVVEVQKVPVERQEFSQLYDAFDELTEKYYKEVDQQELVYGAINGMFDALGDPYTDYMSKDEASSFNENLSSSFQGIGAEIQERSGYIMVVSPIRNSPAEKAGLLPQDLILSVDGESIEGLSASEAVLLIRGEKGTEVTLEIKRGEADPMTVKIIRDDIPIETVYGELDEEKIGHVQVTSFSENTAQEFKTILSDLEEQGMKGLILDVRQNPGGYLNAAIEMANLFVPEGEAILQVQDRDSEPQIIYAEGGKKYDLPVTVLIDEGSASASEILAAALSESAGAKLVGLTSFGKGTIQEVSQFDDGANLKFTTGKWLTPKGTWINEEGIAPDEEVQYPEYASLPYIDPEQAYEEGTEDSMVEVAELMLQALNYNPGEVDEAYTAETTAAIKKFQTDNEIEATGILTGDTTYSLMDALRVKLQTEDPQMEKAKQLLLAN